MLSRLNGKGIHKEDNSKPIQKTEKKTFSKVKTPPCLSPSPLSLITKIVTPTV